MPLEDLIGPNKFITNLVREWPLGIDPLAEGDDHLRGIKNVLRNSFPTVGQARYPASFILPPNGEGEEKAGAVEVAVGTDAQRPATPSNGALRWNTTSGVLEQRKGAVWSPVDATKSAGQVNAAGTDGVVAAVTPSAPIQVPTWDGTAVVYDAPYGRGYIDGMQVSDGSNATSKTMGPGGFRNVADTRGFRLASSLQKDAATAWAEGDGQGGYLPAGSLGANQSIHYVVFSADDDGRVDWGFDTDAGGANVPSGWTFQRRVGSIITDGSGDFPSMRQRGDNFYFNVRGESQVTTAAAAPVGAVALVALNMVPRGVELSLFGGVSAGQGNGTVYGTYLQPYWATSIGRYMVYFSINAGSVSENYSFFDHVVCDTQARVNVGRHSGDNNPAIWPHGWTDLRGKDA